MMEGKAGVSMESKKKMSRAKSNSPMKRSFRRAVAWLLVFCMCMANMNSAVYAAEIATSSDALMAATPSDATATDSNAAEILMPEETVSGEELKEEAIRAISAGHEFDFDSEIRVVKDAEGKNESYSELFKGYRSFTLFADNGNGGRLTGGNDNAYGYIVVRVDKDAYEAFEKEEGTARATGSDATGSSAAERVWSLTGDEELIFLYVNADNGTVTFSLNIENLEADDIVVPSRAELYEDTEEEAEETSPAEKPAEDANEAGGFGSGGGSGSGSGSSGDVQDDPTDEGASDDSQAEDGQTDDSQTENDSENDTDAEKPDEKPEDGQTGGGSENGQENNGSSDTDKEDGNTDSDADSNSGSGSENAGDSGNADSNGGNSGSGSGSDNGKDEGGSSNQGSSSDKGDSHQGGSDSNSGSDSGNAGNSGNSGSGSSDKGNSGSSSDKGGSDSDSAKLSKSSLNLPTVMGPNPNAEFEEDEFGDMSFDEWQEMMEEEEEEAEEDEEDYTEEVSVAYDSEDEGISYLNMTMLPAVGAVVKKTEQTKGLAKLFKSSRSNEAEAVVMAGSISLKALDGITVKSAYKQIEELEDGNYRLHLGLSGGGDSKGFDVVLVVDESNSMDEYIGDRGDSRMDVLKKALYGEGSSSWDEGGFIRTIAEKYPQSRFSVVTYGSNYERELGWTRVNNQNNLSTVLKEVGRLSAYASDTNYEFGLWGAIEQLKTRNNSGVSDNIPVVVFLTDGLSTAYSGKIDEFDYGKNNNRDNSDYPNENVARGTMAAALGFNEKLEELSGSMYVVGFGVPSEIPSGGGNYTKYTPKQYLGAMAGVKGYDGEYKIPERNEIPDNVLEVRANSSNPSQDLNEAFDKISESLKMTNVVINDRLSKYVEFLGTDGEPTAATDAKVVKIKNGIAEPAEYRSLSFLPPDEKNSTWGIELRFGEDVELDPEATYELQFTVKKNAEAFAGEIPAEDIVPGDADTNYKGTDISSPDKTGVRTNSKATYSYGTIRPQEYPHPIIPVPEKLEIPDLAYQKAIEKNESGNYTLTLDVTSPVEETITEPKKIPAEIVFLIDRSGSMADPVGGYSSTSRQEVVNDALDEIIPELCRDDYDLHIAGYQFAAKTVGFFPFYENVPDYDQTCSWTDNAGTALNGLKITTAGGRTMPAEPLETALNTLKNGYNGNSGKDNVKKYFVFLTDGKPDGESNDASYDKIKAMDLTGITFYAVGISKDASIDYLKDLVKYAQNKGADIKGGVQKGSTEEEVKAVFNKIKEEIAAEIGSITYGFKGICIQDTLSEYADLVSTVGEIKILKDGEPLTAEEMVVANPKKEIIEKTIKVTFDSNYELEKDAKYSISFEVKPSEFALEQYKKNAQEKPEKPYGDSIGEDGTGSASAGQPGFCSNKEATLTYIYGSYTNTDDPIYYQHPVLQVPQTGQFVVQKIVTIDNNETPLAGSPDQEFIIQIQEQTEDGTNGFKSSVALKDGEMTGTVITEGEKTFNVHEIVPMEYEQSSIVVYENDGNGNPKPETAGVVAEDGNFTVLPGQNLIVRVTNTPVHKDFFHDAFSVTNKTKGDASTPFSNDLAEQAAKTASRLGLTKKKTELEQEEGDLIA